MTFLALNRRIASAVERRLPFALYLEPIYQARVNQILRDRKAAVVLDVGAGKETSFDRSALGDGNFQIIALDVERSELVHNRDTALRLVADASREFPLRSNSVDVIVSRTVMEHLPDVEQFIKESARVLRPGGIMLHYFPAKWAPFTILNRLLPHRLSRRILFALRPESRRVGGFPAYYDRCSAPAFTAALQRNGFSITALTSSYYQSTYFAFFFPAYLVSAAYDALAWASRQHILAAFLLIEATKARPAQWAVATAPSSSLTISS